MKFYTYIQNNSGGRYYGYQYVIIEASSYVEANSKVGKYGVYFDGCNDGRDCPCCGDRWHSLWSEKDGYPYPAIYSIPITEYIGFMGEGKALIISDGKEIEYQVKSGGWVALPELKTLLEEKFPGQSDEEIKNNILAEIGF